MMHAGSGNCAKSEQQLPCEWIELPSSRRRIAGKVPLQEAAGDPQSAGCDHSGITLLGLTAWKLAQPKQVRLVVGVAGLVARAFQNPIYFELVDLIPFNELKS